MRLLVTGLNHRSAPVEVRERVAFDANSLPPALHELRTRYGFSEGLILSTCNRVEVAVTCENGADPGLALEAFLQESRHVEHGSIHPHLYRFEDAEAIRHIFRVAASLDSMVVGEPQILGQLKSAYAIAKSEGAVNGYLDNVVTRAFSVAKRVRTETTIGQNAVSVSYAAVELAREIFGDLQGTKVLIVGAGKMSELAARHLRRSGASGIHVTNRTYERAVEMAGLFQGQVIEYDKLLSVLPEMDIVITSSGAPHYILRTADLRRVMAVRRKRPVFLIDIAVPRNIEPSANELEGVFLYDIDDLQKVVESNRMERQREAQQAEDIIDEEVERLLSRMKAREIVPTIVSLQEQLEHLRMAEIERVRGKLGALTPQQQEAVDALTRGIVNKVAHGPIAELRRHASLPDGNRVVDVIRRVFRLD